MADFLKSLKVKGVEIDTSGATSGQVFQYNGTKFLPTAPSGGATISDTPPVSPTAGQFWFESDTGKTFVYYDSFWVEVSGGGGFRSGVVTSSTRPTNPFEGQIIYETDTNRVLVYDNTAWVMIADTDTPPAIQLVKTQVVGSGVTSVTVNDAFSSEWENYRITLSGGTISADAAMWIQLGSSTTGYYGFLVYNGGSPVGGASNSNNNRADWCGGGTAGQAAHFSVDLFGPNNAAYTKIRNGQYAAGVYFGTYTGEHRVATAYTSFTIGPESGTITGGTIRVYGFRNAI